MDGVLAAQSAIERRHKPDGYNVGFNIGAAAGQTVFHLHVHVIPRYTGDVENPRGGVRHVISGKADYGAKSDPADNKSDSGVGPRLLVTGSSDPLLPHIRAQLDRAHRADFAVAFVLESGLRQIEGHLVDFLNRGGRLRFLTGDYLGVTQPDALARLLDLEGKVELRVYESRGKSFHPKAYLFHDQDTAGTGFVGSSNLSETALGSGIEWNYQVISSRDHRGFADVLESFEKLFESPQTVELSQDWIADYRRRWPPSTTQRIEVEPEPPSSIPEPHEVQKEALQALEATRMAGNEAGLVVLATGLGKTWLSAFDSARPEYKRILFVAHREEILAQARATFRQIRPAATLGHFMGSDRQPGADVLFASIQTLGRANHLRTFDPKDFDYIIVDEFHHAAASTYRRLIDYFRPKFLLGLTATPERTDGGNLLALCQENLVFRVDFAEGIRRGLLSPFGYFGVPDEVDYTNIPWRSNRFDEEALTNAVATQARAQNALEQYQLRAGSRTLGFCCSVRHADFMADFFTRAGLRAVAVHSGPKSAGRATALESLADGTLDIVFAVDIFNEGLDLPSIDTVMMLRPTESRILWLQQFGRGLRKVAGKARLTVIDYIGNHRTFLLKPMTLLEQTGYLGLSRAMEQVLSGSFELPPGCEVTYDLKAVDIIRGLLNITFRGAETLQLFYEDFREREGVRPTASEVFHAGYNPGTVRQSSGSWLSFVKDQGGLDPAQQLTRAKFEDFLLALEKTPMTKGYKMLVLQAMLSQDAFPGEITIDKLTDEFASIVARSAALRKDVEVVLSDRKKMRKLLEDHPIKAWTEALGTGGTRYFEYDGDALRFLPRVSEAQRAALQELTRELADWRLNQYLSRAPEAPVVGPDNSSGAEFGKSYMRQEIPGLFGLEFNTGAWQQGLVATSNNVFLMVTLNKSAMNREAQFKDRFLGRDEFQWESPNSTTQSSKPAQRLSHHAELDLPIHLFVRPKKLGGSGKAAPFIYCGKLRFSSWQGEKPIEIRWKLERPLSESLLKLFGLSTKE